MEWISVKDKLPEKNRAILTYDKDCQIFLGSLLVTEDNDTIWVVDYFEKPLDYVTHWMPLPQPPNK